MVTLAGVGRRAPVEAQGSQGSVPGGIVDLERQGREGGRQHASRLPARTTAHGLDHMVHRPQRIVARAPTAARG